MPHLYLLNKGVTSTSSNLVVSFLGPNPTKTSCEYCRVRKRKCNGAVPGCGKFNKDAAPSTSGPSEVAVTTAPVSIPTRRSALERDGKDLIHLPLWRPTKFL
ncbi:hypothetical protein BC829DRAFT_31033 [Chytridium lagenaria]|nr:hypothetical protein BC829DRAFT_31033 [Chytridium lagenaria]